MKELFSRERNRTSGGAGESKLDSDDDRGQSNSESGGDDDSEFDDESDLNDLVASATQLSHSDKMKKNAMEMIADTRNFDGWNVYDNGEKDVECPKLPTSIGPEKCVDADSKFPINLQVECSRTNRLSTYLEVGKQMVPYSSFLEEYKSIIDSPMPGNEKQVFERTSKAFEQVNLGSIHVFSILIQIQIAGLLRERGDCLRLTKNVPEGRPLTTSKENIKLSYPVSASAIPLPIRTYDPSTMYFVFAFRGQCERHNKTRL